MIEKYPSFFIGKRVLAEMKNHVIRCLPEEACGLLGGESNVINVSLPVENEAHLSTQFRMDAVELVKSLQWLEDSHLSLLGIYHSHPKGPPHPSRKDIDEFLYPGVVSLIIVPEKKYRFRAFYIECGTYREIKLETKNHRAGFISWRFGE